MFSDNDRRLVSLVGPDDRVVETATAFDVTRMDAQLVGRDAQRRGFKPKGFWYGIGPGWLEWMEAESMGRARPDVIRNLYALKRGPATVLRVEGPSDVARMRAAGFLVTDHEEGWEVVDWAAVAALYCGFELAWFDREWNYRNDATWLFGYDAPSGCAWTRGVVIGAGRVE